MKALHFFANPLDLKWSGTVCLKLFKKKDTREDRQAITPVLVVRDTPAARAALDTDAKPLTELELAWVLGALRSCQERGYSREAFDLIIKTANGTDTARLPKAAQIDELCLKLNR